MNARDTITSKMNNTKITPVEVKPPPKISPIVIPPSYSGMFSPSLAGYGIVCLSSNYVWTNEPERLKSGHLSLDNLT